MRDSLREAEELLSEALLSEHLTMYAEGRIRAALLKLNAAKIEREQLRVDRRNECEALREKLRDAQRKGY